MNAIHAEMGLGQLPDAPIIDYLTRSLSLLYASLAPLCGYLARRPSFPRPDRVSGRDQNRLRSGPPAARSAHRNAAVLDGLRRTAGHAPLGARADAGTPPAGIRRMRTMPEWPGASAPVPWESRSSCGRMSRRGVNRTSAQRPPRSARPRRSGVPRRRRSTDSPRTRSSGCGRRPAPPRSRRGSVRRTSTYSRGVVR